MEPEELKSYASVIDHALKWAKSVKEMLPAKEKEKAESIISELQLVDIKAAQQLGYPTCRCSWPPSIMLKKKGELYTYYCPNCQQGGALGELLEH